MKQSPIVLAWLVGFLMLAIVWLVIDEKKSTPTKQPADHERYYCHETGFLMHHWQHGDKSKWEDALVLNKFEEPIKCELPE